MTNENDGANEPSPTTDEQTELPRGARDHETAAAPESKARPRANADATARGCSGDGLSPTESSERPGDNPDGIVRRFFARIPGNGILLQGLWQLLGRSVASDETDVDGAGGEEECRFVASEVQPQRWANAYQTVAGALRLEDVEGDGWITCDVPVEVRR